MGNLIHLFKNSTDKKEDDLCHSTVGVAETVEQLAKFLEKLQSMRTLRQSPRSRKVLSVTIIPDGNVRFLTLL